MLEPTTETVTPRFDFSSGPVVAMCRRALMLANESTMTDWKVFIHALGTAADRTISALAAPAGRWFARALRIEQRRPLSDDAVEIDVRIGAGVGRKHRVLHP